jgi:F-type H+-transporting ATPase subunit a
MLKLFKFSALATFSALTFSVSSLSAQHEGHHSDAQHATEEHHEETTTAAEKDYDPTPVIMHHISDSHGFHIYGEGEHSVSFPLPVILWTEEGLVTFSSSEFHHDTHGHHVVERKGLRFVNHHEKIYQVEADGHLHHDEEGNITNVLPADISITKNVFSLLLSAFILCVIFLSAARKYKNGTSVPKGLASFVEPLIVFVRDDIAKPNIGPKFEKFMPYLLTVFFLIWINNLMGLIPFFPFSANLSGNIAFTMVLSVVTLLVTNFNGNKGYWSHILLPPVPKALWPIMIPVEIIGIFTKPFALMIRLFANITAGHIIVLSLISLVFIFKNVAMAGVAVPFALFISVLELLVAALQAYIFTLLTSLFIGQAVVEDHH